MRCSGKIAYGALATARAAVTALRREMRDNLRPYWCGECAGWHVGHKRHDGASKPSRWAGDAVGRRPERRRPKRRTVLKRSPARQYPLEQ